MREIKFRAWDNEKNKFITSEPDNPVEGNIRLDFKTNYLVKWNRIELMQYTGLKDKKGKEIYEGDILKITPRINEVVRWNEDSAAFFPFSDGWASINEKETEVIGNIYENVDLLK